MKNDGNVEKSERYSQHLNCTNKLQSVTKIMEKTAIWTILCLSPLPPLNNFAEQ